MKIDPKFVELTADVAKIILLSNTVFYDSRAVNPIPTPGKILV